VWPGIPGFSATWTGAQQGLTVLVQFIEGDRTLPRVVGFDGRAPTTATLDAFTTIALGVNATSFAARADKVSANLDVINHALTITGLPVAGGGGGTAKLASDLVFQDMAATKVKVE
jgi:hypothetical protein